MLALEEERGHGIFESNNIVTLQSFRGLADGRVLVTGSLDQDRNVLAAQKCLTTEI